MEKLRVHRIQLVDEVAAEKAVEIASVTIDLIVVANITLCGDTCRLGLNRQTEPNVNGQTPFTNSTFVENVVPGRYPALKQR